MRQRKTTPNRTTGDDEHRPDRRPGRWLRRYVLLAVVLGLLPMLALAGPSAEGPGQEKVDAQLVDQLAVTGRANFWVRLEAQADLSAAKGMDWEERGWHVYRALLDTATASQRDVLADLKSRGLQAETYWINNSIHVRGGSLRDVQALAARSDVARIMAEEVVVLPEPPAQVEGVLATDGWGVDWIHAPDVWAQGVDGSGIVVANIDTGVQSTHPQLYDTYRGTLDDGSHAYNWCDPSDICAGDAPCDNHGHGTHVMGTLSGENDHPVGDPNTIGVAPGSTWIACKGCEGGSCSDYALLECAEWVLAPTSRLSGNCGEAGLGDPSRRPHVVNNSWGDVGGNDWYLDAVQAWRAAGIFPAFSAGNQSACRSVGSPGDYRDSFASGNLSGEFINPTYSSRGPGERTVGGVADYYCKPNVAAPGTSIYSSYLNSSYTYLTGTSMASPHSAASVALLWDACPELIGQIDVTFQVLELSATTPPTDPCAATTGCADAGCNCTYGAGSLDALAAVQTCLAGLQMGSVHGAVRDLSTGDPLEGVAVSVVSSLVNAVSPQAVSDPAGYYTMTLLAGTYGLMAHKEGYYTQTVSSVVVSEGAVTPQDFDLEPRNLWTPVALPNPRPIDWTRFDGAFDPHDNKLYFPGGQTGSMGQDPSIWTYDSQEDRWADTGCDLNHGVTNYTAAYVEDDGTGRGESLYVIGGYVVEQAVYTDVVQRYYPSEPGCLIEDVSTDPFPGVLSGYVVGAGGVAVVENKIYYVGGWQARQEPYFTDQTWVYDPLAAPGSRWTEVVAPRLAVPRSFPSAAALGGKIYALGGFFEYDPISPSTVPTDTMEVLDLTQPELGWQPLARLPMATAEGRAFAPFTDTLSVEVGQSALYVAGGSQWPAPVPDVSVYDVPHDLWDAGFPDLTVARRNHAGAYVPACTPDPYDGLPAMWVFGGQVTNVSAEPPYGEPEYWPLACPDPVTPTAQLAVEVAGVPVASAEPVTGTALLTVRFVDRSVGVLDRRWDFGDGSPPSDNWRPVHTYSTGHYTVTLTVSNTAGSDQARVSVIVEPLPHRISYLPLIVRRE